MLSLDEKRRFWYLYYTSYLWNTQGLFIKIKIFLILVIKKPICNIYNFDSFILVLVVPGAGDYHFGVGILDLEQR